MATLRKLANPPPFPSWPDNWANTDTHRVAAELHAVFASFLATLTTAGRSRNTITAHTANLWLLGGEIMAFFRASPANSAQGVAWYFATCMPDGDGPVPKHLKRKAEVSAYQATCRQLLRYVRARRLAESSPFNSATPP